MLVRNMIVKNEKDFQTHSTPFEDLATNTQQMLRKMLQCASDAVKHHKVPLAVLFFLFVPHLIHRIVSPDLFRVTLSPEIVIGDPPDIATLRFIQHSDFVRHFSFKGDQKTLISLGDNTRGIIPNPDFGGMVGQVGEAAAIKRGASNGITRCSTTVFSITHYLCGEDIALRKKVHFELEYGIDVESVVAFVNATHDNHIAKNTTERYVLRLGLGQHSHRQHIGISHVWCILFHEDGTFSWLQSFIGHYSLKQYMAKKSHRLTYHGLIERLHRVQSLTLLQTWSDGLYESLFDVAPAAEELKTRLDSYTIGRHQASRPFTDYLSPNLDQVAFDPQVHGLALRWDAACITDKDGHEEVFEPWFRLLFK